jgi:UDP-3-O-[3-hydroxymyristoyl] glucosamine N-acyltransferase
MQEKQTKTLTAAQLAQCIGAELLGEGSVPIKGVSTIEEASAGEITFLSDEKHRAKLAGSHASAVITAKAIEGCSMPQLIVKNVDAALIAALTAFAPKLVPPVCGIHPSAVVEPTAQVAPTASIGPAAYIGHNAKVGERSSIAAGCCVGEDSVIGSDCRLDPNVVVYHNCTIGSNVILLANTTIGSTGFGYVYFDGRHNLVPHNGGVIIEDFVEIGANSCVDRAKFGNTIIGAGTKIDNLVQIAHNVTVGKCCLIVAQVGIAGSCKLGNGVVLGGQVGMADHITIGDGTMVAAQSGVVTDLPAGQKMGGTPAREIRETLRIVMAEQRLPDLVKQVKELTHKVAELEAAKNNTK